MDTLRLPRPDDWHVHLRDGAALAHTVAATAEQFGRAIVMPNLKPPVVRLADARAYRGRILSQVPAGVRFDPLMTLYLTDQTTAEDIDEAVDSGIVSAVKLYPAGATTNSAAGVTDLAKVRPALEAMQTRGLPLLVHGEVTDPAVDIFDREAVFIEEVLAPLLREMPELRVVLEHITTAEAAWFVGAAGERVGATITAHHLLENRNALFVGGIRPHYYCLPVLKRETDRAALLAAATGGDPSFFLGTDSAPHPVGRKESACGCAGCYTAHAAMELYAEAFDSVGRLDRLEGFASRHGPGFYGLPVSTETLTLTRGEWTPPATLPFGADLVRPWRWDAPLKWRVSA